ncbi:MAG: tRNA (adenosine(37)-N6)-threonylcarbamoyltransferase complex dimerization subunit type 1 TsaB [Lachnospiraceae bacterium]|nr:tRNA (adenosine(37)-N6)-threonylcarbamoyltransferase complex dimerization subunit type 1 TsaB [Lachnospiraceae bacterium]
MKILALDSSGMTASVAVAEDEKLLAEYSVNYKKTHSQTLLPMLKEIADMIELDLNTVDAIAVAGGPGSFTGLRIGSATAKGLGLALKKPLVHVPTLEGMACNLFGTDRLICPMMDARRDQVYTGIYEYQDGTLAVLEDQMAVSVEEIAEKLNRYGRAVILLGDGAAAYQETLAKLLNVSWKMAPANLNRQHGAAVAVRAMDYIRMGKTETAMEHQPDYLRVSQAERERSERFGKQKEQQNDIR